jgi:hypothetical protein
MELTCYVNVDFYRTWDKKHLENDPNTACLQSNFVMFVAGPPVYWQSKLQTMMELSTADIELIALFKATRFIKLLFYPINNLHHRKLVAVQTPCIFCQIFEANVTALEIRRVTKVQLCMRHINAIYHHFKSEVFNDRVKIQLIRSMENVDNILT